MSSTSFAFLPWLVAAALLLGLAVELLQRRSARRLEYERLAAYRSLRCLLDMNLEHARFSYRPAARALVMDGRAAAWNGVQVPLREQGRDVVVANWKQLPGAAGAAGWIESAMRDALVHGQPLECEYLSRNHGQADRHLVLTAVPLPSMGMLMGTLALRPGLAAQAALRAVPAEPAAPLARSWMPGPRVRAGTALKTG